MTVSSQSTADAAKDASRPRLEVLRAVPPAPTFDTPLLFVHGAYTGAWCWQEHFLGYFADQGFAAHAVSLSGHGGSRGRRLLDSFSIDDYVHDLEEVAAGLPVPPVLIGHSMGGFVVQRYLERHEAAGAVLMCAVPPQGLMASAVHLVLSKPDMMSDLNSLLGGRSASIATLRDALFAQPVEAEALQRYFRLSHSESKRAIWDMTVPSLPNKRRITRTPLQVLGAELDHLISAGMVRATAQAYGVPATIFPGMGHGMMLERDWEKPARTILDWLTGSAQ